MEQEQEKIRNKFNFFSQSHSHIQRNPALDMVSFSLVICFFLMGIFHTQSNQPPMCKNNNINEIKKN